MKLPKIEQIAIFVHDPEQANRIKLQFGLNEWTRDVAEGKATVFGTNGFNMEAQLQFNYQMGPFELELIHVPGNLHAYTLFPEWAAKVPFQCHWGMHVTEWPEVPGWPLVQELVTHSHTNPYLIERGRTFHYRVYDTRAMYGVFTKLIKRIEPTNEQKIGAQ